MWRLDHYWKEFGIEVPLVTKAPSQYIREQILLTTQPLESPAKVQSLHQYLAWLENAERMVMFSTDYPHWDFDDPQDTLKRLPREHRERIAYANAAELYGLPALVPA
jgi:predicted TIM-barrel fold metal-dependent hydrolase